MFDAAMLVPYVGGFAEFMMAVEVPFKTEPVAPELLYVVPMTSSSKVQVPMLPATCWL